jgi:pilus assembly protein TadC
MSFHIPFTIASIRTLKKKSKPFRIFVRTKKESKLKNYLKKAEVKISREDYLSIVWRTFFIVIVVSYVLFSTVAFFFKIGNPFTISLIPTLLFGAFAAFNQRSYPKVYTNKKQREIDKNLIPALEDMLVQLSSGVPLFNILINISSASYGELSNQFKKAVKKINAGFPQIEVIEELGENNISKFFRKSLWQISNGMKAGSNITEVVKDTLRALNEEQLLQIQTYGNKLNPLIMFYMLISVILPALAITFLTIISSLINLPKTTNTLMFIGLYVFVVLIQIMFIGAVRSSKPSLL